MFSELLTRHRSELYGYIFAVVRSWDDADDLFQAVCVVLWSKFESFQPDTDFFAWARQTAKYKVSKFLRHRQQPLFVNEEVLETLTTIAVDIKDDWAETNSAALRRCREKLAVTDEKLLKLHYGDGFGTRQIAGQLRRSQQSVCRSLNRIRCGLLQCIQKEVARQEHPGTEQP